MFKRLSRRDDLISLANILAFYFIGKVSWSYMITSKTNIFENVKEIKLKQTPETICSGEASKLLPFVEEVYSYSFKDEPHYGKLK
jgi:hypothetical protein